MVDLFPFSFRSLLMCACPRNRPGQNPFPELVIRLGNVLHNQSFARYRDGRQVPCVDQNVVRVQRCHCCQGSDPEPRGRGRPSGQCLRRYNPASGYLRQRVGCDIAGPLLNSRDLCRGNITTIGQILQLAAALGACDIVLLIVNEELKEPLYR